MDPLRRFMRRAGGLCLSAVLVYATSYLVWSRCYSWGGERIWSFYQPPAGLMSIDLPERYRAPGLTPWEGWKRQERIPGLIFWPCIRIDEAVTGRIYLPTYEGVVCFN